jgi:hypothetical protein
MPTNYRTAGLVAFFPFDESAGTSAYDPSGDALIGTISGRRA